MCMCLCVCEMLLSLLVDIHVIKGRSAHPCPVLIKHISISQQRENKGKVSLMFCLCNCLKYYDSHVMVVPQESLGEKVGNTLTV